MAQRQLVSYGDKRCLAHPPLHSDGSKMECGKARSVQGSGRQCWGWGSVSLAPGEELARSATAMRAAVAPETAIGAIKWWEGGGGKEDGSQWHQRVPDLIPSFPSHPTPSLSDMTAKWLVFV